MRFLKNVTTKKRQYDVRFDFQLNPNPGSENPFRNKPITKKTPRFFEARLIPGEGMSKDPNVIHLSPSAEVHAIYYRVFVPREGVLITEKDLPRVFAYDSQTGEPTHCPEPEPEVIFAPDLPQHLLAWIPHKKRFTFKSNTESIWKNLSDQGNNAAIPYYLFHLNKVKKNRVLIIRFKAPHFFDIDLNSNQESGPKEVRYWSICTQNLVKGETLNCLPDFLSRPDEKGYVTLVVGRGEKVKSAAHKRAFNFLEDKRKPNQKVMQLIYRNLLPSKDFSKFNMYEGEYLPTGRACTEEEFLEFGC